MRHKIKREKLHISSWEDIFIPGLGLGYVTGKENYGRAGRKQQTIYTVMLHDDYKDNGVGGYFVKEDWIRRDNDGLFIDIDQLLLDSFNIGV